MIGLGTIINSAAIVVGGLVGHFSGKLFKEEQQDSLTKTCGVCVLFIAIAGAMQGMLSIDAGKILSGKSMLLVLTLALGTIIGELCGIEKAFEHFGEWLKNKTGNSSDSQFVNAFVAIEDSRFYTHNGIDIKGIIRAAFTGIANGFHFNVSVCVPDDASCYLIDQMVSFSGKPSIKLLEY